MKNFVAVILFLIFIISGLTAEGTLFVGLEGSTPPTFHTDMAGFPNVTWSSGFTHDVSGAAATPDGTIYLCEGAFTTHLYQATLTTPPQQLCTIANDMSALAYGNGTLYGYSNYATPKGIYSIDPNTGATELVLDVYTGYGFMFFALDFNPEDGLFYGYTEYGTSGLYSINTDTGEMLQLTGTIPATNGQGRGMAVGDNTVYLTATRGDDGIPYFAYDISQGTGGTWVEFPNPYPAYHSTGGAAWIPAPIPTIQITGRVLGSDAPLGLENCNVILTGETNYQTQTNINGDFLLEDVLANAVYNLEISLENHEIYYENIQAEEEDIDVGTIILDELAYPAENVLAEVNVGNTEVTLSWDTPSSLDRELEFYDVYRFQEVNSGNPIMWDLIADDLAETSFVDTDWILLEPGTYQYAVVAIYTNSLEAEAAFSNLVEFLVGVSQNQIPQTGYWITNYPNPFKPSGAGRGPGTTISFSVAQTTYDISLEIFNTKGQKVKTIPVNKLTDQRPSSSLRISQPGNKQYSVIWNGTDENNRSVPSGIYLYKLKSGNLIQTKKMILMK